MNISDYLNSLDLEKLNKLALRTSSDILVKKDSDVTISDTSWIDMIEESIPYLDSIIRNPRRFIVQEENIVPIEKTKVVTEESIRHLAQNTNLIQEVNEDGTVIPLKLLNVYREETVDLYENRFIKSLVDNLYTFVDDKLKVSDQKSYAKVSNNVTYQGIMKESDAFVKVNITMESALNREIDASKDGLTLAERIEHIRDVLAAFRSSQFIKNLKEANPVRSPIRKTNVILKEPNFQKALELWEFLEKDSVKPGVTTKKESVELKDKDIKDQFDLAFLIGSLAIDSDNKVKAKQKYDNAIVTKLVNDFVFANDISEVEFRKILNKEFKEANKNKEKVIKNVRSNFDKFISDFDKNKKKAYALLK